MTTPAPPITEPDLSARTCPSDEVGPCATCHRPTHKYGRGARSPLCDHCDAAATQKWGRQLRAA
jgi:hypothetical protein